MEDKSKILIERLIEYFQQNDFTIDEISESLELAKECIFKTCKIKN
jgi:hypothetical protein